MSSKGSHDVHVHYYAAPFVGDDDDGDDAAAAASAGTSTLYTAGYTYTYLTDDMEVSDDDDDDDDDGEGDGHAPDAAGTATVALPQLLRAVHRRELRPAQQDVYIISHAKYARKWFKKSITTLSHPALATGWLLLAHAALQRDVRLLCGHALTNRLEWRDRAVEIEDAAALRVHRDETRGVTPGNFGDVFVAEWELEVGDKQHRDDRCFVKRQRLSPQYASEVSTLIAAGDMLLPTPRLLGVHFDGDNALMALALSAGRPAHKVFAGAGSSASLCDRLVAAIMFTFALKCCHHANIIHNDVALRNFMTDGRACFHIVDFGLSLVVADEGAAAAAAAAPTSEPTTTPTSEPTTTPTSEPTTTSEPTVREVPFIYRIVPMLQAAPETSRRGKASFQSDVWQLGWMLYELFTGDSFINRTFGPLLAEAAIQGHYQEHQIAGLHEMIGTARPDAPDPEICPTPVFELVLQCLTVEPAARPSLGSIISTLGTLLSDLEPQYEALAPVLARSASIRSAYSEFLAVGNLPCATLCSDCFTPLPLALNIFRDIAENRIGEELDLSAHGEAVGPDGARALAQALRSNSTLKVLNLRNTGLNDEAVAAILDALREAGLVQIELISFILNQLTDASGPALADALRALPNLSLQVFGCRLSAELKKSLEAEFGDRFQS